VEAILGKKGKGTETTLGDRTHLVMKNSYGSVVSAVVPAKGTREREGFVPVSRKFSDATTTTPRLCFVGPMVGRNPGFVTTQGQRLADLFLMLNYPVISVSAKTNRYHRLGDIVKTLILNRQAIDIMMLEVYSGPSFVVEDVASQLGKWFGHRIIMVLHGGAMPEFIARFPKWTRRVLSRADVLVAPSPFNARAVTQFGFEARVIPNVIDLSAYRYRQRRSLSPRLFWMRTFHEIWNPMMAVRVLARLRQTVPDATLLMAGQDKGLEAQVQKLAISLGLRSAVRFAGFLDMQQKVSLGNECDIFINSNHLDNMPVAIVEACAMGLPVVATDVGGIKDLLTDGETALLVPDNDDEAMVRAIKRLLNEPDLAGQLSAKGRELAERSSWEKVQPQWERVFAVLLNGDSHEGVHNL
jgi:L-malate glycosyltransferase